MNTRHFLLGMLWLCALPAAVQANDPDAAAPLEFRDAWIRAVPPSSPVMAGYVTIVNGSRREHLIQRAESAAFGAVELHEMRTVDGVMRMRPLSQLRVEPEASIALAPGGVHLMLFRPTQELRVGQRATITFVLSDASREAVEFEVRPTAETD